ncbi:NAD(P)-dependent alcohol dehydrogenase [Paractinoplanes toevensis]|uniref:Zinc-binding alcohol dehydrogenase n=1 Tax=Paractinoplanes toevensis TaxID=571911 RepID=A0A919TAN1_9ACTN|nr:NAD(P)-dependent alcohol dehydrogenase [Actinoplanes toevensis]GIM90955.1 zinc-binding alcohol dehydrogenase [Actinoplanes toevensis]
MRIRAAVTETTGGPFVVQDLDLADPQPHEVLVKVTAAGLCHTDLTMQAVWPRTPMVFGHEGAGVIEAIGAEVTGLAPGDHVCLTFHSCGTCEQCTTGRPAYCRAARALNASGGRGDGSTPLSRGGSPVHGGFFGQSSFATYAIAHQRNTVRVPADLPATVAAPLGCSVQTGAGTVLNRLRPEPGESLLVIGCGGVGLSAVMAGVAAGCEVTAVDPIAARTTLALELGAKATGMSGRFHHIVDTTSRPEMLTSALAALRPLGNLAIVGIGHEVTFDIMKVMNSGARIHGVLEGDSDPHAFIPQLIDLHRGGALPIDRLITTFAFENIAGAVSAMRDGTAIKPVLVFD